MRKPCLVALAAALLVAPALARAEARARGITVELGLGANGLTDDDYVDEPFALDVGPLVGLHVAVLYRILPYVSAGVLAHYGFLLADGESYDDEYSGMLGILAEARGHYAIGRFEPWLGFGLGYATAHSTANGEWLMADVEGAWALHGVGIGVGAGLNIYLTDTFALGPFFRMIFGGWATACRSFEWEAGGRRDQDDDCDDVEDVYDDILVDAPDDLPHLWIVGITGSATF